VKLYVATALKPPFSTRAYAVQGRYWHHNDTQKSRIYDAIHAAGKDGIERNGISTATNLAPAKVGFYLSELKRVGLIAVKGDPTTVTLNMTAEEAALAALLALETALKVKVRETSFTPDMDRAFVKYLKIKEHVLHTPGPEGKVALRLAVLEMIKLVY